MKEFYLRIFLTLVFVGINGSILGDTIHTIIVSQDQNASQTGGKLKLFLNEVGEITGFGVIHHDPGMIFNSEDRNLSSDFRSVLKSNDVVVFLYSGQLHKQIGGTPYWPYIHPAYCGLNEIAKKIKSYGVRLVVAISENEMWGELLTLLNKENTPYLLKNLFHEETGVVIVSEQIDVGLKTVIKKSVIVEIQNAIIEKNEQIADWKSLLEHVTKLNQEFQNGGIYWLVYNKQISASKNLINDQWIGLPRRIDAVIPHPSGYYDFFSKDHFYRFDFGQKKVIDSGIIGVDGWYGAPTSIHAALLHPNGKGILFQGHQFFEYDFAADKVVNSGVIGKDRWLSLPSHPDAVVSHPNGSFYFFKNNDYLRYSAESGKAYYKRVIGHHGWKLLSGPVEASVVMDDGKAYFFWEDKRVCFDYVSNQVQEVVHRVSLDELF